MLAGVWILAFMPLIDFLQVFGWTSGVPVPSVFPPGMTTLDRSFLFDRRVDQPVLFCIGVVLLFSKERGRRSNRLDWTRRWGILCSYVTLLLSAAPVLFLSALVWVGISAIFLSMPLRYQPPVTGPLVEVSATLLRYGPQPKPISAAVLVAFSSVAILLACVALFDALRSSGPKRLAAGFAAPLALFSLIHFAQAARCFTGASMARLIALSEYGVYFRPGVLVGGIASFYGGHNLSGWDLVAFVVEAVKWCDVFAIAIWLSLARLAPWRRGVEARQNCELP